MFNGAIPFKSFGEGMSHYECLENDKENNLISLHNMSHFSASCYFPWEKVSPSARAKVERKYILNDADNELTFAIKIHTYCSCELKQSIIAMALLEDEVINLVDLSVPVIKPAEMINVYAFVSAVGFENLFFVLTKGSIANTFVCIEVHPTEDKAYRKVLLHSKQVFNTLWQGEHVSKAQYEALLEEEYLAALTGKTEQEDWEIEMHDYDLNMEHLDKED